MFPEGATMVGTGRKVCLYISRRPKSTTSTRLDSKYNENCKHTSVKRFFVWYKGEGAMHALPTFCAGAGKPHYK